jgi:hypothetical protein
MVCVALWRPSGVPVIDEMLSKVAQARLGPREEHVPSGAVPLMYHFAVSSRHAQFAQTRSYP